MRLLHHLRQKVPRRGADGGPGRQDLDPGRRSLCGLRHLCRGLPQGRHHPVKPIKKYARFFSGVFFLKKVFSSGKACGIIILLPNFFGIVSTGRADSAQKAGSDRKRGRKDELQILWSSAFTRSPLL